MRCCRCLKVIRDRTNSFVKVPCGCEPGQFVDREVKTRERAELPVSDGYGDRRRARPVDRRRDRDGTIRAAATEHDVAIWHHSVVFDALPSPSTPAAVSHRPP